MDEAFDPNRTYQIWFRGFSIKFFIEGLKKYADYLSSDVKPGNTKITEEYETNGRVIDWLNEQYKKCNGDWDMAILTLPGDLLVKMKSTLPYLLNEARLEREEIISKNRPVGATEAIDQRIAQIEELMASGMMPKIKTTEIMGKISKKKGEGTSEAEILDSDMAKALKRLDDNPDTNDRAIDDACTTLEDRLRQSSGLPTSYYGEGLVDKALRPETGIIILSDNTEEQEGYWLLFKGFLKALKNPLSHRRIRDISRIRGKQIIIFADHLSGLLGSAKRREQ